MIACCVGGSGGSVGPFLAIAITITIITTTPTSQPKPELFADDVER